MKKILFTGLALAVGMSLIAAPAAKKDPVAEGFLDWDGLNPKNHLFGRELTPSDLRHRVVVYVALDGKTLSRDVLADLYGLFQYGQVPSEHTTTWESAEMPRDSILIISVLNPGKQLTPDTFKEHLSRKGLDNNDFRIKGLTSYTESHIPVYKDVKPVGAEAISADRMPYVAIYGGVDTEDYKATKPLRTWDNYTYKNRDNFFNSKSKTSINSTHKAAIDALGDLNWKRPLGVADPQFYKKVVADFEKGKPAQGLLNALKGGLKDKNPDKAREAQILFDAINQYREELKLRIMSESHIAPARAYVDYQILMKLFPTEKKSMKAYEDKFKAAKEIGLLGKTLEKMMMWEREDFFCKSDGEAKKIVSELQKMKKMIAPLTENTNAKALGEDMAARIQGEAMVFTAQIDALIETIPTKVVQK